MGMNKRTVRNGAAIAGAALLMTVAGCGTAGSTNNGSSSNNSTATTNSTTSNTSNTSSSTPVKLTKVRYSEVIRSVFYAPQYVAMAEGFFKDEGINVDMVTSNGSNKGADALLSNSADIALVGPETSIYIYNQHGSKTVKAFYQLTNTDGSFLLSRKPIKNFSWSDLQGKTVISWRPGSEPQMVFQHDLDVHHVKANVITNIAAQAMVGAFESGKGDFITEYEPTASRMIKAGKAYYVTSVGKAVGAYPETAYEATSSYIQSHPKVIQEWTNALVKATSWINSHSTTDVAKAIQPYFSGMSVSDLAASIKRYEGLNTWSTPVVTKSEFNKLQSVLIENGTEKADQKVKYSDVVDPSFAQKASGTK